MATARELIRALWENCPYDARHSSDPESGWNFTGLSGDSYVSMNLLGRSQRPKYVYCVKKSRGDCHVFVSLIVNNRNPHCEELKKKAEKLGDVYVNDDSEDGDFEVRREPFPLLGLSLEDAQELACDKLSELYRDYNEIAFVRADGEPADYVNDGRVFDLAKKRESQSQVQQDLTLCPVNWTEYRDFWDDFVEKWFDEEANPNDDLTGCFRACTRGADANAQLNIRELPEPYYGDGAKCKGVLVHLNPGASDPNELSKIYGRGGFLIGKFETDCEKKYSTFAARYSSLLDSYPEGKDPHSVPGHDWWHQDGRCGWIKRFYGDNVSMADIFALEACPYHSASWKGRMGNVEEHIAQRVIAPAVAAASHLEKPCAVFVGSGYNSIIQKIKGMSRILFKRGTRVYSLYKYDPSEDQCAKGVVYLLVVNGCQGMYLPANNPLNAEIEKEIDGLIRTR